jgi:hypothetical protein
MSNKSDFAFIPEELAKFNMLDPYLQQCSTLILIEPNAGARFAMHSQLEIS